VLLSGADLADVNATMSSLVGPGFIPAGNVELYRAVFVNLPGLGQRGRGRRG